MEEIAQTWLQPKLFKNLTPRKDVLKGHVRELELRSGVVTKNTLTRLSIYSYKIKQYFSSLTKMQKLNKLKFVH